MANSLIAGIEVFYKLAQEFVLPKDKTDNKSLNQMPTNKPITALPPEKSLQNKKLVDPYAGATGEERQKLIEENAKKKGYVLVPKTKTVLNEQEVIAAARRIMQERYPDLEKEYQENLAIALAAQCKLETGFVSCYNFNTGNYHAVGGPNKNWKGKVFAMSDPQGYGASTYVNLDKFFRAYDNIYDGLSDQFSLLERKMSKAVEAAKIGDAYNFGMELGRAGYYTANKDKYSTSVKKIFDQIKAKQTQNLA